jgi:hypothetical protein
VGITYRVDRERRLVLAEGHGTVTDQDVFGYQREVWSRSDVAGFSELVDMTRVRHLETPSGARPEDRRRRCGIDRGAVGSPGGVESSLREGGESQE